MHSVCKYHDHGMRECRSRAPAATGMLPSVRSLIDYLMIHLMIHLPARIQETQIQGRS